MGYPLVGTTHVKTAEERPFKIIDKDRMPKPTTCQRALAKVYQTWSDRRIFHVRESDYKFKQGFHLCNIADVPGFSLIFKYEFLTLRRE